MKEIIREVIVTVTLTPEEAGKLFAAFNSEQQAQFFNAVASYVKSDYKSPFDMQMHYLMEEESLNNDGRRIMETIGNYAYKLEKR